MTPPNERMTVSDMQVVIGMVFIIVGLYLLVPVAQVAGSVAFIFGLVAVRAGFASGGQKDDGE